tara:strand:- start:90 stop:878 length:789 start_codon:yes stop_codon:yes gene_type:complete
MEKYFFEAVKSYGRVNIPKVGSFSWNKGNLEFNLFSTYHDGKFLKYLKEELKWDNEKATSLSSTWFSSISDKLNEKKSYMLKGYGTLLYQNDKIVFNKQIKYRKNKILLFGLLSVLFASASVVIFLLTSSNETKDEDITVSFVESKETNVDNVEASNLTLIDTDSIEIIDSIITPSILKNPLPVIELQNKYEDQYIIIAGTFSKKSNAIGLYESLIQNELFSCKVIYNGSSLYWVSVYMTSDKLKAKSFLRSHKINGWIKKI